MTKKIVLLLLGVTYLMGVHYVAAQDTKTFIAGRDFCSVEIRAGNLQNPTDNSQIYNGSMVQGQRVPRAAVFLFAQREANPGVCDSGRGFWQQCSWGECTID